MITLAYILSGFSLLMSAGFLIKPKTSLIFVLIFPLASGALSPYWAIMGAVGAVLGWVSEAYWAIPMGIVGAGVMICYVWRSTHDQSGFENAFGVDWSEQIKPEQEKLMVQKRWKWYLKMNASPEPFWERDIPFWTIPVRIGSYSVTSGGRPVATFPAWHSFSFTGAAGQLGIKICSPGRYFAT